nr:hypothetical protein [Tanacetum cinerariifolium]
MLVLYFDEDENGGLNLALQELMDTGFRCDCLFFILGSQVGLSMSDFQRLKCFANALLKIVCQSRSLSFHGYQRGNTCKNDV